MAEPELSFAGLLRRLRTEARLTQEELAEAGGVSPRSVSDLERGINRTARKDTALLLAGALNLAGPVRELFVAVRKFLQNEDGPTAVEMAVMLALIVIVCLVAITSIGTETNKVFSNVALNAAVSGGS